METVVGDDRTALIAALTARPNPAGPYRDGPVRVPERVRHAVLPDAGGLAQQLLEARILQAIPGTVDSLRWRPPGSLFRPAQAVISVRPGPDQLVLQLSTFALGPLLSQLLPYDVEDTVSGVAGLRHRHVGADVELYIVEGDPCARVRLAGITRRKWFAAVGLASVLRGLAPDARWLGDTHPDTLSAVERDYLQDALLPVRKFARVGSALLRRWHLFVPARSVSLWWGHDTWWLEWTEEPLRRDIAAMLTNPIVGLSAELHVSRVGEESVTILRAEPAADPQDGEPRAVVLRHTDAPTHEGELHFRSGTLDAVRRAWELWSRDTGTPLNPQPSPKSSAGQLRASFTGEHVSAATAGVGPDDSSGLDHCSPAQRELRFLLALYTFNAGPLGAEAIDRDIGSIIAYTVVVSPRHDELVLFTDAPDNVTGLFVGDHGDGAGFPGMRLEERPNSGTFCLLHLPTGARMTITSRDEAARYHRTGRPRLDCWVSAEQPVVDQERAALSIIPSATPAMMTLIGGLFTRITAEDVDRRWSLGMWWRDPLYREPALPLPRGERSRRLWGALDQWELTWEGNPFAADVVASLSDPFVGIAGVAFSGEDPDYRVCLDEAALRVHGRG
ncbi:hypothetical protein ACFORO_21485 [Amycolatopsis halotolerans]|uniref:Uncharacterized protein n=1 Tax=Amycolatopsis halotolerans TaxID=330083 RepID=A0ABV7QI17_9PSEU